RWRPVTRLRRPVRASSPPRPRSWSSAAAAVAWCRSAPRAAWAWSPFWSAEPLNRSAAAGALLAQPRHPVLVALLEHRPVVDLLAHIATRHFGHRLAAIGAQGVGIGLA